MRAHVLHQELSSMIAVFHSPCCSSTSASSSSITILLASITKHAIVRSKARGSESPIPFCKRVWPCTTSSYLLLHSHVFVWGSLSSEEINGSQFAAASSPGSHDDDNGCSDCSCSKLAITSLLHCIWLQPLLHVQIILKKRWSFTA